MYFCSSGVFQSTLPHGERHYFGLPTGVAGIISIHAPAWGATGQLAVPAAVIADFNPRSPHGERRNLPRYVSEGIYFNPRSPHGERPERN